ncbi:hypothetical protein BV96_00360 [Sphingomonas paucimobilis]|uniref:TonB-dependent receptor n=1 Tax=Sphingobium sp. DC-2 TaxID=1303256 RepID=UPI0004527B12|nr:TonB-dependent receptor [Sphingobium sp. DC-2]EZP74272.1 hypothetical protein BV96_00360 [Sphingomonas paucimobilis]
MTIGISRAAARLSGVALWTLASAAAAQAQVGQPASGADVAPVNSASDQTASSDIIVTATRRNERLQDVPVTVTAITSAQIENLQIKNFQDVQVLSPGLSFRESGTQGTVTSLRGISSTVTTSAPAAVVIYLNEVPINDFVAFQGIYDIGQIEVLRGPQGTLRGVAAPVGSITIGTRRPDLNDYGGTFIATGTDQPSFNGQAAVNVPIIKEKLAVRIAGLFDVNRNGDLHNPVTDVKSRADTKSIRASVLFQPINPLSIFAYYQYMRANRYDLTRVEGTGFVPTADQPFPAGYNGPVIRDGRDGIAVQENVTLRQFMSNNASINAKLNIADEASLSYIFGYSQFKSFTGLNSGDTDTGNAVLNYSPGQLFHTDSKGTMHELRLDSMGGDRLFDYSIGVNYLKTANRKPTNVGSNRGYAVIPGVNPPSGPATLLGTDILIPENRVDKSAFASATLHLPTRTDITFGARRLHFKRDQGFQLWLTTDGVRDTLAIPLPPPLPPLVLQTPTQPLLDSPSSRSIKAWVYDAKVVQHLDDDKIIYFSYGRGFRGPGANRGVDLPALDFLRVLPPEKSDSYEIGFKGDFFDRRIRFNFDVFQQDYKGFNSVVGDVPFCTGSGQAQGTCGTPAGVGFGQVVFSGNARVRGFEAELSANITDRWTASGTVAYAKSNFKNAQVPYRPDLTGPSGTPDGIPDTNDELAGALTAANPIFFQTSNGPISEVPKWNFTVQSEYTHPLSGNTEGFIRGLFTYQGKRSDVSGAYTYAAEPILNLYVGAREIVPGLELTLFARNLFDTRKLTFRGSDIVTSVPGSSASDPLINTGYHEVRYGAPREIGITARFVFGSD